MARTDTAEILKSISEVKNLREVTVTLADHVKILAERLQKVEKRVRALEAPKSHKK